MPNQEQSVDQLIVVVHGVGDPEPGDPVGTFARSIALESKPLKESRSVVWLNEKASNSNFVQTFPVNVRNLRIRRKHVKFAEVFWGDLSKVARGVPGMVIGLFQILFGLRYIAYVAADQSGTAAMWLKKLGLISSRILHGPVLAVTLFLALLAVAVSGSQTLWENSYQGPLWSQILLTGCSAFGFAVSLFGSYLTRNRVVERACFWLGVTSLFMFGLMWLKAIWLDSGHQGTRLGLIWHCRVLIVLMGWLWFCEIIVMIAMAICWFVAVLKPRCNRRALNIALLLPVMSIGIWGQAIPMFWISARTSAKRFLHLNDFAAVFDEAIPLLGVQFIMCIAFLLAGIIVGLGYLHWRSRASVGSYLRGSRPPRLIVHGGLQLMLSICAMVGVSLVVSIGTLEAYGKSHEDFLVGRLMAESNKYAMTILVPVGFLIAFAFPRLQPVFDIILDVVNHFYFRPTNVQDALDDDDEFDIAETTFESGNLFFSRRQAVHSRMQRILTHFRDSMTERPELIIIAHSQGTQVAIEVLNDPELDWLNNQFRTVKLVTMGSPFTNLYQHYFRHLYPSLDSPYWASLRRRVDRWVNIFRIDDPVGTEIDFAPIQNIDHRLSTTRAQDSHSQISWQEKTAPYKPAKQAQIDCGTEVQAPIEVSNHPVGCRGHVNYWVDREVLDIIHDVILEPELADVENRKAA